MHIHSYSEYLEYKVQKKEDLRYCQRHLQDFPIFASNIAAKQHFFIYTRSISSFMIQW